MKEKKIIKILIAGEGGQGAQAIAKILAETAFIEGHHSLYIPNFGVEQRGGVSIAFLQISNRMIPAPKFEVADYQTVLSNRAYERTENYIGKQTKVFIDPDIVTVKLRRGELYEIPAAKISNEQLSPRVYNMVFLGALAAFDLGVDEKNILKIMHKKFKSKYSEDMNLKKFNKEAFKLGKLRISAK